MAQCFHRRKPPQPKKRPEPAQSRGSWARLIISALTPLPSLKVSLTPYHPTRYRAGVVRRGKAFKLAKRCRHLTTEKLTTEFGCILGPYKASRCSQNPREVLKSPRVPYNILARGPPQNPNKVPKLPASDGRSHTNTIKQHFLTPRVHTIMQGAVEHGHAVHYFRASNSVLSLQMYQK